MSTASQEDTTIDGWRCCAGGFLGVRRVAHSPNDGAYMVERTASGALQFYNAREDISIDAPRGSAFLRVPASVMTWLTEPERRIPVRCTTCHDGATITVPLDRGVTCPGCGRIYFYKP